jgi:low temperature requirement protein LtrA
VSVLTVPAAPSNGPVDEPYDRTMVTPALADVDEAAEQRVTPLELFFDLVFVFALTQVTSMLARDPTWRGLARGMLVLAALWWAWVGYSWLTNAIDPEEVTSRLTIFVAMGAMLVATLALPRAFGEDALVFGVAYFVVRVIHVGLYLEAAKDLRGVVGRLAPFMLAGSGLLVVASLLDGTAQGALWCVALAIDFGGGVVAGGTEGWRLSPGHFAERHGLIIIIALGESIVAIGAGAAQGALDAPAILAVSLGLAAVAALWWAYFDVVAIVAERHLREATGAAQAAMARDSYSFLHLPMLAGIVLLALGIKKTVAHVDEPLAVVPAVALCGGAARPARGCEHPRDERAHVLPARHAGVDRPHHPGHRSVGGVLRGALRLDGAGAGRPARRVRRLPDVLAAREDGRRARSGP